MLSRLRDEVLSDVTSSRNSNAAGAQSVDDDGIQLDLSSSKINNAMVTNMLCGWKCCHTITLANNSIGDEAIRQLCQSFYSMAKPLLSQLSLAYNCLTDTSACELATLITTCSSMDALDVEGNMLSVDGIRTLAKASSRSKISALHLSHNTGDPKRLEGSMWVPAFVSGRLKTLEIAQHFPEAAQANLESLMRAASESRRLVCLDIRGAVFGAAGIQPILQMLHKCSGLRELRVSVSHESDKSELLLGAAEANPRCMLVVTAQASAEACENALVIQTGEQADTLQSLPDSDGTASERPGCMMALVERTQGGAVAKAGTHLRRARCSTASASLKCSQQSRRAFKQTSGLCKGSSAGGAAQRGAQVFMRADRRGTGSARLKDLSKALKAFKIDGFSSKKVVEVFRLEAKAFHKVENATMSLQEFLLVYDRVERGLHRYLRDCRIAVSHGPQKVPKRWVSSESLPKVFAKFCNLGRHRNLLRESEYEQMSMSNTQWVKLMEEMSVIEPVGPMGRTSADMIFFARAGVGRKLSYAQFLQALLGVTGETGWTHHWVHDQASSLVPRPKSGRRCC